MKHAARKLTVLCSFGVLAVVVGCSGGGRWEAGRDAGAMCQVRGLQGTSIAPVRGAQPGCGVAQPVRITAVDGVALSRAATMDCQTAAALTHWVRGSVKPTVAAAGAEVSGLRVAAHYVCRTRNHREGARVSEHGKGRAIDISAFLLTDGSEINVLRDWGDGVAGDVLRQMHAQACGTFGTTLGPGSDGMHEDHFHYDTARHGGGPYCR